MRQVSLSLTSLTILLPCLEPDAIVARTIDAASAPPITVLNSPCGGDIRLELLGWPADWRQQGDMLPCRYRQEGPGAPSHNPTESPCLPLRSIAVRCWRWWKAPAWRASCLPGL